MGNSINLISGNQNHFALVIVEKENLERERDEKNETRGSTHCGLPGIGHDASPTES